MIGLVLVTHGRLASAFSMALQRVAGPQTQIETVNIGPDDDMARRREDIVLAIRGADSGVGVIVLTDMFGGTPSNLAISAMEGEKIDVVAGVNLPMLIALAAVRETASLEQAVSLAQEAGRKSICIASKLLANT